MIFAPADETLKIYHQLRLTQQKVFEQLYLINEYWFFSFKRILNCLPCVCITDWLAADAEIGKRKKITEKRQQNAKAEIS